MFDCRPAKCISKEVFLGFQSHLESVEATIKTKLKTGEPLIKFIRVDTDMSGLQYPICVCGLN
jgi:hypothetical protein